MHAAPADARIFPRRRSQRARNHEAVRAAGTAASLVALASARIRRGDLRFDVRIEGGAAPDDRAGAAGDGGDLRESDDAAERARDRGACEGEWVPGGAGRSGTGELSK